jgi:hypothetical protein
LNLDKSISNLSSRLDRFDSSNDSGNELRYWKGRKIIPLNEWIQLRGTPYALDYFPDDFNMVWTSLAESDLKNSDEAARKWYSDYLDLMEHKKNPNYGRAKCFHCLLSPDGDDPIFIGINRLVAKGLQNNENQSIPIRIEYPCPVANRFECPYDCEKGKVSTAEFKVEDLFELANIAFAVEIALAVARKDTSVVQIKNKQDLYQALTDREMLDMILKQGLEYVLSDKETFDDLSRFEKLQKDNRPKIVDYFMNIRDKINLEELRFY